MSQDLQPHKPRSRVFLTNWGYHDYKQAERFGELVGMTGPRTKNQPNARYRVDLIHTDRTVGEAMQVLEDHNYDPEHDFILLSGSPVLSFYFGYELGQRYGRVRILFWEAFYQDYLERTVQRKT